MTTATMSTQFKKLVHAEVAAEHGACDFRDPQRALEAARSVLSNDPAAVSEFGPPTDENAVGRLAGFLGTLRQTVFSAPVAADLGILLSTPLANFERLPATFLRLLADEDTARQVASALLKSDPAAAQEFKWSAAAGDPQDTARLAGYLMSLATGWGCA